MKSIVSVLFAAGAVLAVATSADARPWHHGHHRVCVWRHHHQICHMR